MGSNVSFRPSGLDLLFYLEAGSWDIQVFDPALDVCRSGVEAAYVG